jgi:hypothetical protein
LPSPASMCRVCSTWRAGACTAALLCRTATQSDAIAPSVCEAHVQWRLIKKRSKQPVPTQSWLGPLATNFGRLFGKNDHPKFPGGCPVLPDRSLDDVDLSDAAVFASRPCTPCVPPFLRLAGSFVLIEAFLCISWVSGCLYDSNAVSS